LNDGPYGRERSCNGLRLAMPLQKKGAPVELFLMGDAVNNDAGKTRRLADSSGA